MNIPLISKVECPQRKGKVSYGAIILFKREPESFQSYWFIVVFVFAAYTVTETSPCYCRRRMLAADPSSPPQSLTLFSILSHPAFLLPLLTPPLRSQSLFPVPYFSPTIPRSFYISFSSFLLFPGFTLILYKLGFISFIFLYFVMAPR